LKIAFAKVANKNIDFELKDKNLNFSGVLKRLDPKLVECLGKMKGEISYICVLSDGVYIDKENELSDTMEFFDGNIDLNEVFKSELEAFKSDYFYCKNCRNL